MPPGTGDVQIGLAQDIKPNGAVIVSTPPRFSIGRCTQRERNVSKGKYTNTWNS